MQKAVRVNIDGSGGFVQKKIDKSANIGPVPALSVRKKLAEKGRVDTEQSRPFELAGQTSLKHSLNTLSPSSFQ